MRTTLAYVLMTAAFGGACSQSTGDDHGFAASRKRWSEQALAGYRFTWQESCYCPSEWTRPIEITVASRQIVSAVYVDDQIAVSEQVRASLRTVEGVFDDIQAALDRDPAEIELVFDPTRGYPTSVFVDYNKRIADEELQLELSDLTSTALQ